MPRRAASAENFCNLYTGCWNVPGGRRAKAFCFFKAEAGVKIRNRPEEDIINEKTLFGALFWRKSPCEPGWQAV
jgi:hypothetical protein